GLCCVADAGGAMQSHAIAEKIAVPRAETAKILQLLAWGGFVKSRRGTNGGFQLAANPDQITTGQVIDFFVSKFDAEVEDDCPIMLVLRETTAPCQEAFRSLTLADIAAMRYKRCRKQSTGKAGVR